jgi:polysaccharide biosynthesis/export protein
VECWVPQMLLKASLAFWIAPRTGTFPLVKSVKVFEALNVAGSFMDFANKSKIIIARGDKRIPFNYNDVLDGKNLKQNIELEPGDTIIVK